LDFRKKPVTSGMLRMRLAVALGIFPKGDHRDWNAIHLWAKSLPPLLLQ